MSEADHAPRASLTLTEKKTFLSPINKILDLSELPLWQLVFNQIGAPAYDRDDGDYGDKSDHHDDDEGLDFCRDNLPIKYRTSAQESWASYNDCW